MLNRALKSGSGDVEGGVGTEVGERSREQGPNRGGLEGQTGSSASIPLTLEPLLPAHSLKVQAWNILEGHCLIFRIYMKKVWSGPQRPLERGNLWVSVRTQDSASQQWLYPTLLHRNWLRASSRAGQATDCLPHLWQGFLFFGTVSLY